MLRISILFALLALAACGVRGSPENPTTVPGKQLGEREPVDTPPAPDRDFVLDPLLD